MPVYDKVGIGTARSVQAVVDTVFEQGEPLSQLSVILKFNCSIFMNTNRTFYDHEDL